jgi:hypothetical protein
LNREPVIAQACEGIQRFQWIPPGAEPAFEMRQQLDQRLDIWTFLTLHPIGHGAGIDLKEMSQLLLAAVGAEEPILQSDAEARIGGRRERPRPRAACVVGCEVNSWTSVDGF